VLAGAGSWNFWNFALFRAITGAGIGIEYSAVDVPTTLRSRIDMPVNGNF
jgi:hypothetical protein